MAMMQLGAGAAGDRRGLEKARRGHLVAKPRTYPYRIYITLFYLSP
jgi:hypothetical protein